MKNIQDGPRPKPLATIKDVATEAGVSIMTVSRVLNQNSSVKPSTREKVEKAIKKIRYRPNIGARALSGKQTFQFLMLYNNPNIAWMGELMIGLLKACRRIGYHLSVEFTEEFESRSDSASFTRDEIADLASVSRVDGIILPPPISFNKEILKAISETGTPCVRIAGTPARGYDLRVSIDNYAAGYEITEHLIELGHESIAFIKGPPISIASALRYDGYSAAMRHHGLAVRESNVVTGSYDLQASHDCARRLLSQKDRPTAIFASTDEMTAGLLAVIHELKISVPDQLSVAGFDDATIAHSVWPELTTVRAPLQAIGEKSVELLANFILEKRNNADGKEPRTLTLPYELTVRSSTGPCPP
jgi:LacI family transcriptional regulator